MSGYVTGDDSNMSSLTPEVRPRDSPLGRNEKHTGIARKLELTRSVKNSIADSSTCLPSISVDHSYSVEGDSVEEKQQFNSMVNETTGLLNSSGLYSNPLYSEIEIHHDLIEDLKDLKAAIAEGKADEVMKLVSRSHPLNCAIKKNILQELDKECFMLSSKNKEFASVLQKNMDIFSLTKEAGDLIFRIIQEMSVR